MPSYCKENLPTMTIAKDRILKQEDYDNFAAKTPFFIIGVSDSTARTACESESLL